jgi:hypothetical protein
VILAFVCEGCGLISAPILILSESLSFGPSGVRALPLAAGINVGGHYKWHFFSLFLPGSLLILTEGLVVGFCSFAWAPK